MQPAELHLDRPVDLGHGGEIGLRLDDEPCGTEAGERDRVGRVGEREGELEVGAHGPTLSACAGLG